MRQIGFLLLPLLLSACGVTGPLYLPGNKMGAPTSPPWEKSGKSPAASTPAPAAPAANDATLPN